MSNINMPVESMMTYMMEIAKFALSVTIYEIFKIEISMTLDPHLYNELRSNINMAIESTYMTSYLMKIVMFAISGIIYKIFANEKSKV